MSISNITNAVDKAIRDIIIKEGLIDTGKLLKSIKSSATDNGKLLISVEAEDYYSILDDEHNITEQALSSDVVLDSISNYYLNKIEKEL